MCILCLHEGGSSDTGRIFPFSTPSSDDTSPETEDHTFTVLWIFLFALADMGLAVTVSATAKEKSRLSNPQNAANPTEYNFPP